MCADRRSWIPDPAGQASRTAREVARCASSTGSRMRTARSSREHGGRRPVSLWQFWRPRSSSPRRRTVHERSSAISHWPHSPVRHPFRAAGSSVTPSFTANLRGNFTTSSNTLLTCPGNPTTHRQRTARGHGRRAAEPCVGRNNNDENMRYVNADPAGHFNSSAATVTLPANARVVRAYLYWGADLARGVNNGSADGAPGGEIPDDPAVAGPRRAPTRCGRPQLKVGGRPYVTVDATGTARDGAGRGSRAGTRSRGNRPGFAYQVRADVTPESRDAAAARARRRAPSGRAERARGRPSPTCRRHAATTGTAAGRCWSRGRRRRARGGTSPCTTGSRTCRCRRPAARGRPAGLHRVPDAGERRRGRARGHLGLRGRPPITKRLPRARPQHGTSCSDLDPMKDALNPVDNFFNGTISTNGADLGARTPEYRNQLGFDRDRLSVPEGTIPNGATGASVCLGTTGDTYFFGGIAFDTLIRAPNLQIAKTASVETADPGDLVTYSTEVTNPSRPAGETPTEPATNVAVADPIPSGLDFVDFTVNPGSACSYDSAARTVRCAAGTIAPDGSFRFSYRARVAAAAQGTEPAALRNGACFRANSAGSAGQRVLRLRRNHGHGAAQPVRGPGGRQDRVRRDDHARCHADVDDPGHQPRPRHVHRVRGRRRTARRRGVRQPHRRRAACLHDPGRGAGAWCAAPHPPSPQERR